MSVRRRISSCASWLLMVLLFIVAPEIVAAQRAPSAVTGTLQDVDTDAPVAFAQILLEEAGRSTATDADGAFYLEHIPAGVYTLKTFRIGYESLIQTIHLAAGDTLRLSLRVRAAVVSVGEVVVEAEEDGGRQLLDAAFQLEGRRLRQQLGTTVAETLDDEPGMAMRSMGPAPSRPVLRGLGGERLMVLQDGERTGDLSGTSADHALVIDPLAANRIELIRGPAALAYGPSVLGGVVNVVSGNVPSGRPGRAQGELTLQAQSVNRGIAGGAGVRLPGPAGLVVRADVSGRTAADVQTPVGMLDNTGIDAVSGSIGASYVGRRGYVGVAGSHYGTRYGIPGGFVGAHPEGVDIHMERQHAEGRGDVQGLFPGMPRLEVRVSHSRYHHEEYESSGDLGVAYGLLTSNAGVTAHVNRSRALQRGAVGLWFEHRDYAAGGFALTPASREWTMAGFAHQDLHLDHFTLQAGVRYDYRRVAPLAGNRKRKFGEVAAAATVLWHPERRLTLGLSGVRAVRMPGIEELYSEGPHLAAYSFEVGNSALNPERGHGLEVLARYQRRSLSGSMSLFHSWIDGYIFPQNTGEMNHRVFLPIYRYAGASARMTGGEARLEAQLTRTLSSEVTASYVRGTLVDLNEPIPWMPPLQFRATTRYGWRALELGLSVRGAVAQERVGPFETPTDGYVSGDLFAQYHFTGGAMLHTLTFTVQNVTDTAYRDHLSRVKSIMPEPGRNLRLLYRIYR